MITEPKIEQREEQPYMSIRTLATIPDLPTVMPQLHDEVYAWLKEQGIAPAGDPFIRYRVINMAEKMDIELAVPIASKTAGNGRIIGDVLPAGRYGSIYYTGDYSGLMAANGVLVDWAKDNNIEWDAWDEPGGHAFHSRIEVYVKDPGNETDPAKYETEVAIKVAD